MAHSSSVMGVFMFTASSGCMALFGEGYRQHGGAGILEALAHLSGFFVQAIHHRPGGQPAHQGHNGHGSSKFCNIPHNDIDVNGGGV